MRKNSHRITWVGRYGATDWRGAFMQDKADA